MIKVLIQIDQMSGQGQGESIQVLLIGVDGAAPCSQPVARSDQKSTTCTDTKLMR